MCISYSNISSRVLVSDDSICICLTLSQHGCPQLSSTQTDPSIAYLRLNRSLGTSMRNQHSEHPASIPAPSKKWDILSSLKKKCHQLCFQAKSSPRRRQYLQELNIYGRDAAPRPSFSPLRQKEDPTLGERFTQTHQDCWGYLERTMHIWAFVSKINQPGDR